MLVSVNDRCRILAAFSPRINARAGRDLVHSSIVRVIPRRSVLKIFPACRRLLFHLPLCVLLRTSVASCSVRFSRPIRV